MTRFNKLVLALMPLAFLGVEFLNAVLFFIHRFDTVRTVLVFGVLCVACGVLMLKMVFIWLQRREVRKTLYCVATIPTVFLVLFAWAYFSLEDLDFAVISIGTNFIRLVMMCCAATILLLEKKFKQFFDVFRVYAILLSPVALYYCIRLYLPTATYEMTNLPTVDYMSMAYLLFALILFLIFDIIANGEEIKRMWYWTNYALCLLFVIAIALTGTKGTFLCAVFSCVLCLIYMLVIKKRGFLFPISVLLGLLMFATVLYPSYNFENRALTFLKQMEPDSAANIQLEALPPKPDFSQSPSQAPSEEPSNDSSAPSAPAPDEENTVKVPTRLMDMIECYDNGMALQMYGQGVITEEQFSYMRVLANTWRNSFLAGRKILWRSALQEIRTAPVWGQGPFSFWHEYGTYPHNLLIEIATDFGLIVTVAVLAFAVYMLIRFLKYVWRRSTVHALFLIYILSFMPQLMVSGSVYDAMSFFFFGFAAVLLFCKKDLYPEEKKAEDDSNLKT